MCVCVCVCGCLCEENTRGLPPHPQNKGRHSELGTLTRTFLGWGSSVSRLSQDPALLRSSAAFCRTPGCSCTEHIRGIWHQHVSCVCVCARLLCWLCVYLVLCFVLSLSSSHSLSLSFSRSLDLSARMLRKPPVHEHAGGKWSAKPGNPHSPAQRPGTRGSSWNCKHGRENNMKRIE